MLFREYSICVWFTQGAQTRCPSSSHHLFLPIYMSNQLVLLFPLWNSMSLWVSFYSVICVLKCYLLFNSINRTCTAMDSPASVVITNLVMEHVENKALATFPQKFQFWKRNIDDDIVCCLLQRMLLFVRGKTNPFLDILLNTTNGSISIYSVCSFIVASHFTSWLHLHFLNFCYKVAAYLCTPPLIRTADI